MSYTQNDEERVILDYFKGKGGHLTDIGANDGITFSNSRALIEKGWSADLVEPSPLALERLTKLYENTPGVTIFPYAITDYDKRVTLHESDSHHGDNVALLSTTVPSEIGRWKGTQVFTPVAVDGRSWDSLGLTPGKFISIDAEGADYMILRQIDLSKTDMVCIEFNGNQREAAKMKSVCAAYGLSVIHTTGENLIFAR